MYEELLKSCLKPDVFSEYTAERLWTDSHLAQQMLKTHLDQTTPLASRPLQTIDQTIDWLDHTFNLQGIKVCDLGCGPGLYAERFAQRGAWVEGLDFSTNSIDFATRESDPGIGSLSFRVANYLTGPLPEQQDLVTLIYCDFCALSPMQRLKLLSNIHCCLVPGGALVLDVLSEKAFKKRTEDFVLERNYMNGFWSANDYVSLHKSWNYESERVSLDLFTIAEKYKIWHVYNWLQYYTFDSLGTELKSNGFEIIDISNGLDTSDDEGLTFTVIAKPLPNFAS